MLLQVISRRGVSGRERSQEPGLRSQKDRRKWALSITATRAGCFNTERVWLRYGGLTTVVYGPEHSTYTSVHSPQSTEQSARRIEAFTREVEVQGLDSRIPRVMRSQLYFVR
jgi:hypothetical protein